MAHGPDRRRGRRRRGCGGLCGAAAPDLSTTAPLPLATGAEVRTTPSTVLFALAWSSPVAAALVLAFPSGGYFITDWGVASIILLTVLSVTTLTAKVSLGGRKGALALSGLVGLGLWQGVSGLWAHQPSAAVTAMNQTLLYATVFALVLIGIRRSSDLRALLWACLAASGAVTAFAVGSRLLPDLVSGDEVARLSNPITYWNGLGALVAFGATLSVGMAGQAAASRWARAGAAALVPMFLIALLLTYSRGAAVALIVGVSLLLALAPGRLETFSALALSVAVSIPLLAATNGETSLAVIDGELPPHADAGRRILLLLIATMLASALAALGANSLLDRLPVRRRGISGAIVGCCAVVACAGLIGANMPDAGPVGWAEDQFESFKSYDSNTRAQAESVSDRLAVAAGSGRWQNWEVAAGQFRDSPVVGTGAGDYVFYWEERRPMGLTVVNAHSLYLEILGETGVVGLLLLLTPMVVIIWAFIAYRRRRPPVPDLRTVAVALSAAALIVIHAAGDWDWQLPAVVIPAIALAAGALKVASTRDEPTGAAPLVGRIGLAVGATAALVLVAGPTLSATALANARDIAAAGNLEAALERAGTASALSPQDPAARLLQANLLSDLGRPAQADAAFAAAAARSPRDWEVFADWARSLTTRGDTSAALVAAERAAALNPKEIRTVYLLETLGSGR